jgi:hypothetical protein
MLGGRRPLVDPVVVQFALAARRGLVQRFRRLRRITEDRQLRPMLA